MSFYSLRIPCWVMDGIRSVSDKPNENIKINDIDY